MKILYTIVLYNCVLNKAPSYTSFLCKLPSNDIFVYDNSRKSQPHPTTGVYIHNPNNPGLGVAYNAAAKYAKENGYDWLLLLDQDTIFPPETLNHYKAAIIEYTNIKLFAPIHQLRDGRYISPTKYFFKGSHPQKKIKTGLLKFKDVSPINSGLLVNVEAFFEVGGYDEAVTLDFSDVRFIEKFRKMYSIFYVISNITCIQDFSVNETDVKKLISRYKIYLKCANACKREKWYDAFAYFSTTLKRTIRLSIQAKSTYFLRTYLYEYLLK